MRQLHGEDATGTLVGRNRCLGHCLVSILHRTVGSACPKCPIVVGCPPDRAPFVSPYLERATRAEGSERSSRAYLCMIKKKCLGNHYTFTIAYFIYSFYSTLSVTTCINSISQNGKPSPGLMVRLRRTCISVSVSSSLQSLRIQHIAHISC